MLHGDYFLLGYWSFKLQEKCLSLTRKQYYKSDRCKCLNLKKGPFIKVMLNGGILKWGKTIFNFKKNKVKVKKNMTCENSVFEF